MTRRSEGGGGSCSLSDKLPSPIYCAILGKEPTLILNTHIFKRLEIKKCFLAIRIYSCKAGAKFNFPTYNNNLYDNNNDWVYVMISYYKLHCDVIKT